MEVFDYGLFYATYVLACAGCGKSVDAEEKLEAAYTSEDLRGAIEKDLEGWEIDELNQPKCPDCKDSFEEEEETQ